mmetsp:Transcript_23684/g.44736  ORF Transcript_23684/g.44736 Transcript_23684/m.44736 type:complete len:263 (+) Transcript_23684:741-1529(+)
MSEGAKLCQLLRCDLAGQLVHQQGTAACRPPRWSAPVAGTHAQPIWQCPARGELQAAGRRGRGTSACIGRCGLLRVWRRRRQSPRHRLKSLDSVAFGSTSEAIARGGREAAWQGHGSLVQALGQADARASARRRVLWGARRCGGQGDQRSAWLLVSEQSCTALRFLGEAPPGGAVGLQNEALRLGGCARGGEHTVWGEAPDHRDEGMAARFLHALRGGRRRGRQAEDPHGIAQLLRGRTDGSHAWPWRCQRDLRHGGPRLVT